ncbi:MAG: hypothetical protein M3N46_04240 [Actinomycetota bacterium]|nr:hypothetical protein [Actinomycetota bacterium]
MSIAHGQGSYQVRFDWGEIGASVISPGAHVVVWVDQLGIDRSFAVEDIPLIIATLETAADVASDALRRQTESGARFVIAVVAAGALRPDGSLRFAVEDLLAAGAVIEALTAVGIDDQSPEAAAAASAYTGLRNATRHLISASASSRETRESSEA